MRGATGRRGWRRWEGTGLGRWLGFHGPVRIAWASTAKWFAVGALGVGLLAIPAGATARDMVIGSRSATTAVVGDEGSAALSWEQYRYSAAKGADNPFAELSVANVSTLAPTWQALVPAVYGPPVVAGDTVYVVSQQADAGTGELYAFSRHCATDGGTCVALWTATPPGGAGGGPAVQDGQVFVGSYDGVVSAYPARCGRHAVACIPNWTAQTAGEDSEIALAGGVLYVTALTEYGAGELAAYPERCGTHGASCLPLWTASLPLAPSDPAVGGGVVYVSSGNKLYAFQASCGSGGAVCSPEWSGSDGTDGYYGDPVVAGGSVYVGNDFQTLDVYPTDCAAGGSCAPAWSIPAIKHYSGDPAAIANGVVVLSLGGTGLVAYKAACGASGGLCTPLWTAAGRVTNNNFYGLNPPTIADGVVYAATDVAFAIGLHCGTAGAACPYLWKQLIGGGTGLGTSPVVLDRDVLIGSAGGGLFDYRAPIGCPTTWLSGGPGEHRGAIPGQRRTRANDPFRTRRAYCS